MLFLKQFCVIPKGISCICENKQGQKPTAQFFPFEIYFYKKIIFSWPLTKMPAIREFTVLGCAIPTEKIPSPTIYKFTVWEKNEVMAQNEFCKLLKRKYKIKKSLIVKIDEEKTPITNLKIYGISLVLQTKKRKINMYKEFKAVSRADAVSDLYSDMAGRHSANKRMITIISVKVVSHPRRKHLKSDFPVFGKKIVNCSGFIEE
ncbi:60S ribosomal protein L18A [Pseudoloma neurophilia]|uniref:60S ribosomal protein L18A n=1 Tax=Pseudoloma neurophilia TaxID=146866 RepID=A0A0R0M107_9MICR|nr:60S ribosomal protein L18A [Pseudoloma neurophilia]